MTNGINIGGDITGTTINGIRCGLVSDIACDWAAGKSEPAREVPTGAEVDIARKAARFLAKMRQQGYTKEHARKAFVQKIVDEAQRVSAQGKSNVEEGSER